MVVGQTSSRGGVDMSNGATRDERHARKRWSLGLGNALIEVSSDDDLMSGFPEFAESATYACGMHVHSIYVSRAPNTMVRIGKRRTEIGAWSQTEATSAVAAALHYALNVEEYLCLAGAWAEVDGCNVAFISSSADTWQIVKALQHAGTHVRSEHSFAVKHGRICSIRSPEEPEAESELDLVVIVDSAEMLTTPFTLAPKEAALLLDRAVASPVGLYVEGDEAQFLGVERLSRIRRARMTMINDLVLTVPSVVIGSTFVGDLLNGEHVKRQRGQVDVLVDTDLRAAVRRLQSTARSVYGCLEPERAVAWTLEELGEVAQAMRRNESSARLSEELGQLFSWILCLGNINDIDLADALATAVDREANRQRNAYGRLRPYGVVTS